jgi:hypothetical protein
MEMIYPGRSLASKRDVAKGNNVYPRKQAFESVVHEWPELATQKTES